VLIDALLDQRPRRRPEIASRPVGDGLQLQTATGHDLGPVGARIWQLCDGERTIAQIAGLLAAELHADLQTSRVDVQAFVAQLAEMKLVTLEGGA
jgi:hypothetical protein